MRFTFIHAADLHIDSPLAALGRKSAEAAALFARASREAVQRLVDETIQARAAFLIIAGDVFDREWQHMGTGHFFNAQLAKLERAGIRVFMIRGNHDAESRATKFLQWPPNVFEVPANRAESEPLEDLQVVLHGRSFANRNVDADFVASYPVRREGWLNIGVLHTSLEGNVKHETYAPCSVAQLKSFGYDYWALGHIHAAEIIGQDPWIVYPGNIQGRHTGETGAKGAMRIEVEDGRILNASPIILDSARWVEDTIAVTGCGGEDDVLDLIHHRLSDHYTAASGRAVAARLTLTGKTILHDTLLAGFSQFNEQAQAGAARIADDCWIEKLRLKTQMPDVFEPASDELELKSFDLAGLLRDAAQEPAFAQSIADLHAEIASRLPPELRSAFASEESSTPTAIAGDAQHFILGSLNRGAAS